MRARTHYLVLTPVPHTSAPARVQAVPAHTEGGRSVCGIARRGETEAETGRASTLRFQLGMGGLGIGRSLMVITRTLGNELYI